jgi:hypothetical protein
MYTATYKYEGSEIQVSYVGTSEKRLHQAALADEPEFDWFIVWDATGRCASSDGAPKTVNRPMSAFIVL